MHGIAYSEAARADLSEIGNYIRDPAGDLIAERFISRLIAKVESLRFMPERYCVRRELQPGLRAVLVEKYIVFYRVAEDTVQIVRVLHGAREITSKLFST